MKRMFADNAASELTAAITDTDTTITLADASAFPEPGAGEFFPITLYALDAGKEINHEIMHCTGRSGNTLTVLRGQEGTTARAWDVETPAELRFTSEAARELGDSTLADQSTSAVYMLVSDDGVIYTEEQ